MDNQYKIPLPFILLYQGILPLLFLYWIIRSWSQLSICYQRISILFFIMLIVGIHKFIFFFKLKCKSRGYQLQGTSVMILLHILNQKQADGCLATNDQLMLIVVKFLFIFLLLANVISYVICGLGMLICCALFLVAQQPQQHRIQLTSEQKQRLKKFQLQQKYDQQDCAICLYQLNKGDVVVQIPQCLHFYHKDCIYAWLDNHLHCPKCRQNIREGLQL